MRIISILASPAPGGAEILVRNLSAEYVARGHASHVVFLSDAAGVGNPPEFEAKLLAGLEAVGASYAILGKGSFRNPIKAGRQLRRLVRSFRPDILHIHLGRGLLCKAFSGVRLPTVYTHHSIVANFPPLLFRLLARSVDHYIAIGDACRAFLEKHVRGPISTIPNGVPASFAWGGARSRLPADPFILSVGALRPPKDHGTLVEAAAMAVPRFAAQGREARFAIAGEGSERPMLEALIEERGLGDRFELLGARPDVPALLERADLLVNSSVHEGLPLTLIEGAMSGLPVVATGVGGNPEVVIDGENGFIVPPGDAESLADRIVDILSDGRRYAEFSEAALAHSKGFSIAACAEAHLDLYRSVIDSSRRA